MTIGGRAATSFGPPTDPLAAHFGAMMAKVIVRDGSHDSQLGVSWVDDEYGPSRAAGSASAPAMTPK
jgi:hypothetical protein